MTDEIEKQDAFELRSITMRDGEQLAVRVYLAPPVAKRTGPDLLALPSEIGTGRELTAFAEAMMQRPIPPRRIVIPDMRGRGMSQAADARDSTVASDAADLIALTDALGIHHADIVVNGRALAMLLEAIPARPSLVNRLVLNDAAPSFDPVGLAAQTARNQRSTQPGSWTEAFKQLREQRERTYPNFAAEDWERKARTIWADDGGKPTFDRSRNLLRPSNSGDFDGRQGDHWSEFAIVKHRPTLLIRGETSRLVTDAEQDRLQATCTQLTVHIAKAQGHTPELDRDALTEAVATFLAR